MYYFNKIFICNVKTLKDINPKLPPEDKSMMCIGILNVNNLKSPNHPEQMIIMSDDNKYIFFPITKLDDESSVVRQIIYLYPVTSAFVNNNITIPKISNWNAYQSAIPEYNPKDTVLR